MNQSESRPANDLSDGSFDSADARVETYGIIRETGKRIAKYSAYIFVSTILLKGIVFLQSIVVARLLGPGQLGMLSIVMSLGAIVSGFSGFGMTFAVVRILPEYRLREPRKVDDTLIAFFWLSIITTLPVLGLYALLDPLISVGLYNEPQLMYLIYLWIAGAMVKTFSYMFPSVLQAFQKIGLLAKLAVVLGTIGATTSIVFVWLYGLPGALYASIVTPVVTIGIYSYVLRKKARRFVRSLLRFDRAIASRLLRVGGGILLSGIFFGIAMWYGMTILQRSAAFEDVGYFRVAFGVTTVVLMIPATITMPFYPIIVESHSRDLKEGQAVLLNTAKYVMMLTFPLCLAFVFLSQVYIEVFYSAEFLPAAPLVAVVAGYSFLRAYNAITYHIYLLTERMSVYSIRNGLWFLGLFLMITLIVPTQLAIGLVWSYFAMRALVISADPLFFGKDYRLMSIIKLNWMCVLLGFLIVASSFLLGQISLTHKILYYLAGMAAYAMVLNFVILDRKDKEYIRDLVKSILRGKRER